MNEQVNVRLETMVKEINSLAKNLALINDKIDGARASSADQPPNDLLDRRDLMLQELSEFIGVVVTEQNNGQVNVLVGTGQPLVVGTRYEQLSLGPGRYDPRLNKQQAIPSPSLNRSAVALCRVCFDFGMKR